MKIFGERQEWGRFVKWVKIPGGRIEGVGIRGNALWGRTQHRVLDKMELYTWHTSSQTWEGRVGASPCRCNKNGGGARACDFCSVRLSSGLI